MPGQLTSGATGNAMYYGRNSSPTTAQMQQAGFSVDMMNGGYGIDANGRPYSLSSGGSTISNPFSVSPVSGSTNSHPVTQYGGGMVSPSGGAPTTIGTGGTTPYTGGSSSPTGGTNPSAGPLGSTSLYGSGGIGGPSAPGGAGNVSAGTFSSTKPFYNYGGQQQVDVNTQAMMNYMAKGNPFQNTAQNAAMMAGQQSFGAGGAALNQGQNMYNGANAVMNTAFDPQQALYDKLHQQNTDQTNAMQAQRGITMSPYGAGVANQSNQDFNIGWQNTQLDRQVKGLGAAGQANTTGSNLNSVGVGQINDAGQLPYQTAQQAFGNEQQSIQDYLNYLSGGTNASAGNQAAPYKPSIIFGGNMSQNGPGTVSYF